MNRSLFFALLFLFHGIAYSQHDENRLIIPGSSQTHFGNKSTHVPSYIKLHDKVNVHDANVWMDKVFKLTKDHKIREIKSEEDELGFTHHKFQQYYKDYPVEGTVYIVHEKDKTIHSLNGLIEDQLSVDINVGLSEANALSSALRYFKGEKYIWEDQKEEDLYKSISKNPSATHYPKGTLVITKNRLGESSYRLAYKFDVYSTKPIRRAYVYVDANSGSVIRVNDRIHHHNPNKRESCHPGEINEIDHANVNATGTAATKYSGTQTITTDNTGAGYRLRETGRGNGIQTMNMQRGTSYGSAIDFTDADNNWNTTTNYDNAAYDAHWGAEKTYDYYKNTFNRNSFDNLGSTMYSYVHYDIDYDNAYWDGSRMTYGDGSNTFGGFTALTAIDVIGHELTHGVTEFSANLTYDGESGALNESFSDIMGTTIEFYAKPGSANFLIGDQISYGGGALRNMGNPNLYQQPDTYLGDYWDPMEEVHTNSGVGNFWYFLLCQGGSGTNDVSNTYSVTGIGITKAANIAYRTLTTYLTPDVTYADARFYSIRAAMDLYGPCSPEVQATTSAWYAVGVGTPYVATVVSDFSANNTTFCTIPATVTFNNTSQNANVFSWNFGDGSALSTAVNPTHTYSAYGTYTVTLTATGGSCGSNTTTKTGYIVVSNQASCPINMPSSGTGATQIKCTGALYDSGGQGDYDDLTDGTLTIAPTGAAKVTLNFSSFDFEYGYDSLSIYDGPNTSSPLIGSYTGSSLPGGGSVSSTGGSLTIHQFSDTYVTGAGFACTWSCFSPTSSPVAAFSANPTSSCDGIVVFTDLSTNGATSWNWTFGDGTTSTVKNPVKTYTASGTYTVTLKACNSIGCSSILTKTNYVIINLGGCVNIPSTGTGPTQTACTGRLLDDGGSGNYSDASNGSITIAPAGATKVTLNFSSFNFEQSYDYLYIYDGPNTTSPLIGEYTGSSLPAGGIINSTGGSITLRQVSDGIINQSGFICNWSCTQPTNAPVTAFTAAPTSSCDGIINFTDQSTNGPTSWSWNFGDATTSTTRNPVKTYAANGTYTVTLNACNGIGCNTLTKTNYVVVAKGGCVNIPQTGTGTTQTSCSGRLYDSGGNSDYQNTTTGSITIAPAGASKVNLNFSDFNFESGYDNLYIYDGPTITSPLIGTYTGTTLPGSSGVVSSTGGSITIRQTSDNSVVKSGFVCDWSCVLSNSPPAPAFTSNTSSSCDGVIIFSDLSTNTPTSWLWSFGDGTTSTSKNPTKTYTANGVYNVSLQACNGFGCNTITKNSFVTINLTSCVNIPSNTTGATQTSCSGRLYDSGGQSNYTDNTNGIITIAPTGATKVTLTFSSFSFESGWDYLYIYDGPTTNSPLIGSYSGTSLPGFGTINSTGSSITLKQTSDNSNVSAGFVCDWSCTKLKPVPDFSVSSTNSCNSPITFTDLSLNIPTSWSWTFGDGATSTLQNPVHTYSTSGTYNVSLNACNANGCSTLVMNNLITVDINCIVMNPNGTKPLQTSCSGTIYDSGGSGDYQENTDGTITIDPTGSEQVVLTFSSFQMEEGWDYLNVYDGPTTSSPLIAELTGSSIPSVIISTTGSLTLGQLSDNTVNGAGFICQWSCVSPTSKPVPSFSASTTNGCIGNINFNDLSVNNPTSWSWTFGDGGTSSSQNPVHNYVAGGTYTVSLTACNSNGCNTLTKTNYINILSSNCVIMPATGTGPVQTSCSGTLYDSGGDNDYQVNTNGVLTIDPAGSSPVSLTFTSFDMELHYDSLIIYNGPNTSSPIIGSFSGTNIPSNITSTVGSLTLKQVSDNSYQYSGFVCQWSCITVINGTPSKTNEIILFPNPAYTEVVISYGFSGTKELNITIYDLLGNKVYNEIGSFDGKYENKIDVSSLPDGYYLVKISDDQGAIYKKLSITK